jgi:hypothetical protein
VAHLDFALPDNDTPQQIHVSLDLTKHHGGRLFNGLQTQIAAVAWLASIHGTDESDDFMWAVDRVFAFVASDGTLMMGATCAAQGEDGHFHRLGYQVNVRTTPIHISLLDFDPRVVNAGDRVVVLVEIDIPAPANGVEVVLTTNHPGALFDVNKQGTFVLKIDPGKRSARTDIVTNAARFRSGTTRVTVTATISTESVSNTFEVVK